MPAGASRLACSQCMLCLQQLAVPFSVNPTCRLRDDAGVLAEERLWGLYGKPMQVLSADLALQAHDS